ncbi:macro domain-containing protein [Zooshikella ganghwensis]|uniref:macro domain-containing protein n=1 Tax=Zooshikella ganghwensis TaxID=202772 RepID=UPI0003F80E89|nr:macro domain-containing protein [Zooshikella ganghwensis]
MITFKQGNIFEDDAEALVNPVNCVGVMGKGLALEFKKRFPENFKSYKQQCTQKLLETGKVYITEEQFDGSKKYIVNFPTKMHWRGKSKLEYIQSGLEDLVIQCKNFSIKSVAIPAIGAGLGGLKWEEVKKVIFDQLAEVSEICFVVYEPT